MRRLIILGLLFLQIGTPVVSAVPDQTMTVAPSATSGTTITAADENSRNNSISTPYNAHTHTDLTSTTANTFTIGDGLAGSKSIGISNSGTTGPSLRYNQNVTNAWQFTNNASTFLGMVGVAATFTTNAMLYASGTATLVSTAAPTNGQILIGSTSAAPVLSTLTAGSNVTITNGAGSITVASTGTTDNSARAFNSAAISILNDTTTALTFDSERWDTDTIHSTVSNTGRLTATTAGKYLITGHVNFANSSTGYRTTQIFLNGTTIIAFTTSGSSPAANMNLSIATHYNLAANDYVELRVYQNSGGALDINANANYSPEFDMVKVP